VTEKEQLENAAKAARLTINESKFYPRDLVVLHDDGSWHYWNPLKDDGDAFRLAVELGGVTLNFYSQACFVSRYEGEEVICEELGEDPYAATRRAIVRAAAEIGKAMK